MVMFLDAIEETLFTVTGDIRYSPSDDVEAAQGMLHSILLDGKLTNFTGNGRNHGVQANSRHEAIRTAACEMVLSVLSSCKDVISFSLVVLFLVAFLMLSKIAMYGFLMISVLLIVGVNICDYKNTVDKRIEVKKES